MYAENRFYYATTTLKQNIKLQYDRGGGENRKICKRLRADGQNRNNTCDLRRRGNA